MRVQRLRLARPVATNCACAGYAKATPLHRLGLGVEVLGVAHVHLGDVGRHRAVDVHRQRRDALVLHEPPQVEQHHLGPIDGERRDQSGRPSAAARTTEARRPATSPSSWTRSPYVDSTSSQSASAPAPGRAGGATGARQVTEDAGHDDPRRRPPPRTTSRGCARRASGVTERSAATSRPCGSRRAPAASAPGRRRPR